MRKRLFGVYDPDPPTCFHVNTEISTSLLILDRESMVIFQSAQQFLVRQNNRRNVSIPGLCPLSYFVYS